MRTAERPESAWDWSVLALGYLVGLAFWAYQIGRQWVTGRGVC